MHGQKVFGLNAKKLSMDKETFETSSVELLKNCQSHPSFSSHMNYSERSVSALSGSMFIAITILTVHARWVHAWYWTSFAFPLRLHLLKSCCLNASGLTLWVLSVCSFRRDTDTDAQEGTYTPEDECGWLKDVPVCQRSFCVVAAIERDAWLRSIPLQRTIWNSNRWCVSRVLHQELASGPA